MAGSVLHPAHTIRQINTERASFSCVSFSPRRFPAVLNGPKQPGLGLGLFLRGVLGLNTVRG